MENIFDQAIVLVYPDGHVDSLPIKRGVSDHVKYFYNYLTTSPRFQAVVRDNGFKFDFIHEYNTSPIIKLLTDNGVIVFVNLAIAYINMAPERAKELSMFSITFPDNYRDHVGIHLVRETIKGMDENRYELNRYYEEMNNFDNFDPDEAGEFLEKSKELQ